MIPRSLARGVSSAQVKRAEEALRERWNETAARARADVNLFMELAFCDDQTPGSPPFAQQWFHREWQAFWGSSPVTVMHGATGFGKTEQLVGRVIWELGNDPSKRVALIRKSFDPAAELLAKVKRQIEQNAWVRAVFPKLRPGEPWNGESLRLASAGLDTTTNNVTPFGIDGPLLGKRIDIAFLDDVNDPENTANEERRLACLRWADEVVQSRITTHGWMAIIANAWHRDDLAFTYSRRPGMPYRCYPSERDGVPIWPAFRGREWLDAYKLRVGPMAFARTMLCIVGDDRTRIFSTDVLAPAWAGGAGVKPAFRVDRLFDDDGLPLTQDAIFTTPFSVEQWDVIVGVDLATGATEKKRKTDLTVFFVLGVSKRTGKRRVLWIDKGRWSGPEIVLRIKAINERYQPRRFIVEDNGQQRFLIDFARQVPGFGQGRIETFTTTGEKWHESLGIEGIAAEMYAGRWEIPGPKGEVEPYRASLDPAQREAWDNIRSWATHLEDFARVGHTPDDVMASWFARQGAVRLGTGVFEHTHAHEMSEPPPGFAERVLMGNAPTVAGIIDHGEQEALDPILAELLRRR